ncbi:uncharacterized protein LOC112591678 [Melanaphis sacchari]|uniref:uncharacterized protein LOC112591678 n=1 Tax=Melanaphis sacchari TaxID=742174 RepID=UPI000DC13005|nr:uncharacterized protein LOC112591678 [Melanaphis sacchari]
MISFGIMTVLLVAMACVVHYDLLGLFPIYPYKRRIMYMDNKRLHQPASEVDHLWIPKPGTDLNTFYSLPQPVILYDHDGDGGSYWTDSDDYDYDDSIHGYRENTDDKSSDDQVHRRCSTSDTDVDSVLATIMTQEPNIPDDYDDDNDYIAPGQEKDDDIF